MISITKYTLKSPRREAGTKENHFRSEESEIFRWLTPLSVYFKVIFQKKTRLQNHFFLVAYFNLDREEYSCFQNFYLLEDSNFLQ